MEKTNVMRILDQKKIKYNEYFFVYNINSEDKNSKFTLNYLGDDSKIRLTPSVLE